MSSLDATTTANGPGTTTEQAKEKAQETAQQAKRGVRDQVDQRSTEAGVRVGSMAQDARSVADELRNQGKDQPAKLAEQAADRAQTLGNYLERSDGDTILRDLEDFGRRQPWVVIAGGVALGFAASRFLKASSTRRAETPRLATPSTSSNGYSLGEPGRHRNRHAAGARHLPDRPLIAGMSTHAEQDPRERGLGELVKELASQTSTLVRQEIQLAQAEVTQKGKLAGKGAGMLAGAGVSALLGLGALTALLIVALDSFMALWLATLIVTVLWLAIATALALAGKKALQSATPPVPQTVETVKEDIEWAKTQTKSAAR